METYEAEQLLLRNEEAADRVVRRLAEILRVELVEEPEVPIGAGWDWGDDFPEDSTFHLNADFAFSRKERKVFYAPPRNKRLLYLPHELVHAVWPTTPDSASEEWEEGMIPFEREWLSRLCETSEEKECFRAWNTYAFEGIEDVLDLDKAEEVGKETAERENLPNPWSEK